jgi:hypothetical protein
MKLILGSRQIQALKAISGHGEWHKGCGWKLGESVCLDLEQRGFLRSRLVANVRVWEPSQAGRLLVRVVRMLEYREKGSV